MSEILVDWGQNSVLPSVTLTGIYIFFLASKLHFILVTDPKGKNVQGGGSGTKDCGILPSWEVPL